MVLGLTLLSHEPGFDAERIMPMVINRIPVGVKGYFIAILLAALISMLNAMVNVTSSVVLNDFLKIYFLKSPRKSGWSGSGSWPPESCWSSRSSRASF